MPRQKFIPVKVSEEHLRHVVYEFQLLTVSCLVSGEYGVDALQWPLKALFSEAYYLHLRCLMEFTLTSAQKEDDLNVSDGIVPKEDWQEVLSTAGFKLDDK